MYRNWLRNYQESYGWNIGLGTISYCFVWYIWEMARLGSVFNFNFKRFHAKVPVANNSLIIRGHLRDIQKNLGLYYQYLIPFFSLGMY